MGLEAVVGTESSFFSLGSKLRKYALALSLALPYLAACGNEPKQEETEKPAASVACASDEQCRGERVCYEGKCVFPSEISENGDGGTGTVCADVDSDGFYSSPGCGTAVDCNDQNNTTLPGADELCDYLDNNCNDEVDEGVGVTYFRDSDGDGFGGSADTILECEVPAGYVNNSSDCDDDDNSVWQILEGYVDSDGDGSSLGNAESICSGDVLPAGYLATRSEAEDCNDTNPHLNPGVEETCDGIDNNCNTTIDEGTLTMFYLDDDNDSYGNVSSKVEACTLPAGYVANSLDCNDGNSAINPDAQELCDRIDNNCNTNTDENCPCVINDTQQCGTTDVGECSYGTQACNSSGEWGDCSGNVEPVNELCDNKDNDCDTFTDETFSTLNQECRVGVGLCEKVGRYVCDTNKTSVRCNVTAGQSQTELCDNLDNDCDGSTDEEDACGKIVFVNNNEQIAVINPDRSGKTTITNTSTDLSYPVWSPNGQKIAYVADDGRLNLEVMDASGSNVRRLLSDLGSSQKPSWSPDNTKLTIGKDGDIYVVTVSSGSSQRITTSTDEECCPDWSPDGQTIVYNGKFNGKWAIYTINPNGTVQSQIYSGNKEYTEPTWSPNSQKIAFVEIATYWNRLGGYYDGADLLVMNRTGSPATLTSLRCFADPNGNKNLNPSWSPDGNRIAFSCYEGGYVINADGSSLINFSIDSDIRPSPTWSPNGQKIAHFFWENSFPRIRISNPDGSNETTLTTNVSTNSTLDWKP